MNALRLADLSAPLAALLVLGTEFAHLPAPAIHISEIFPERLELAFHHDDFGAFEAWREALDISPEGIVHRVQGDGPTAVRIVHGTVAGADVRLVGFAPIPALVPVGAGSGAAG
ncbi:hypothetical protein ACIRQY_10490 [Streptomyces sp. NPDC101490]|uniref:hypothetical protein n=1 Tax=Streptomyces sp. NPDC101490 TaxID=3366143 RepID=UPI0037FD40FA